MRKYIDYKIFSWNRLYFKEGTDMFKIIDKLEQGYLPAELCDDPELGFDEFEQIDDTEEYIAPSENDNQPTIEIYQNVKGTENWQECIWDNVNKDKQ